MGRVTARTLLAALLAAFLVSGTAARAFAQPPPPLLTRPVNDFANVVDAASAQALDGMIRALEQASGDVVVVATVDTVEPFGDIGEYAVKMFENQGRGIGRTLAQAQIDRGIRPVTLEVFEDNAPARALYATLGFIVTERFFNTVDGAWELRCCLA